MIPAKKNKIQGFSLVEVIIAMSIAIVVSFLALSVVLMSNAVGRKANARFGVVSEIGNMIECFKASSNTKNFENALKFSLGELSDTGTTIDVGDTMALFVRNNADTGNAKKFACHYTVYYDKNFKVIPLSKTLIATDALGVKSYTGEYQYTITVTLDGRNDAQDSYTDFSAKGFKRTDEETPIYELDHDYTFRKAGAFLNA